MPPHRRRRRRANPPAPPAPPNPPNPPAPSNTRGSRHRPTNKTSTDADGIVGFFHGIDRKDHPATAAPSAIPDFMSWLIQRSDLRWVNCYLTTDLDLAEFGQAFPNLADPEREAFENRDASRHWVQNIPVLRAQGWSLLPMFFDFNWPNRTNLTPTAQAGVIHARMAKLLAFRRGFPPGSVLYIDDEASERDLTANEITYYNAYFAELARPGALQWPNPPASTTPAPPTAAYRPGYYGHNHTAAQLLPATPDLVVWSDDFGTHSPHQVSGDATHGNMIPFSNLDRAPLTGAAVTNNPMVTTYPTDIDARVHPISAFSRTSNTQIRGRLWPMALQRWWTKNLPLPSTRPTRGRAGDSAWPSGLATVSDWDFSQSLVRDPSQPVAEPRLGVSRGVGAVSFGAATSQDAVFRNGAPTEAVRGLLSVNEAPFNAGLVGKCVAAGDGRPQQGQPWTGPYVHPFSPVAGEINTTALLVVTTTGRLALFDSMTEQLRMLSSDDRSQGAAVSTAPYAVRIPHALAMAATYTGLGYDALWIGTDQHLWTATGTVKTGDIGTPNHVRDDLIVHPAARVALGRSQEGMRYLTVAQDGTLVSGDLTGKSTPDTIGKVLASGPLAIACPIDGSMIAVAQGTDHRLMFSRLTLQSSGPPRWSTLAALPDPPGPAMIQPLSGIALFPLGAELHLAAVGSDLKLYEWRIPDSGNPSGPTPLAPPGMPPVHPFSDVAGLSVNAVPTYAIARCDKPGGAIVTATAVTGF